jgi:hypothetical protein
MLKLIKTTVVLGAGVLLILGLAVPLGNAWDAEECWRLDRQNSHGYPVAVPEWCEPHGWVARAAE